MAAPTLRFLFFKDPPRPLHQVQYIRAVIATTQKTPAAWRFASTSTSKPRVLEKPTRFNPPSHGKRIKEHMPQHYGPELTQQQKAEQETKQYPRMMPPPGTIMHWFLNHDSLHIWITLGTLFSLASFVAWENWCRSTTFRDRLPSKEHVLYHPIDSFLQFWDAWKKNVRETSNSVGEKRKRGIDDAQKRGSYRRVHSGDPNQGIELWPPFEEREGKIQRPIKEEDRERFRFRWWGMW
ncbi:MAG: hypothetical protein Q9217_006237 [Psora testacea]